MLSNKSLLLLILLIVASALSAWSITDSYFGNRYGSYDARIYGMGSAGTFNNTGVFGIADNPANLTLMQKKYGFAANSYINRDEDNRAAPFWNQFDYYIDDAVYSSNIHVYDDFAGSGFIAHRFNAVGIGMGVYHKPVINFDADYREDVRNNRNTNDDVYANQIALNTINGIGAIYKSGLALSLGYKLGDYTDLNFGFDYALLDGDVKQEKSIRWTDFAINAIPAFHLPNTTQADDYTISGTQMKIGVAMQLNTRFGIAATYTPKATLDKEGTHYYKRDAYRNTVVDSSNVSFKEDYIMPTEMRFGFSYTPRNVLRTVFNMDVEYVLWSEVNERYDDMLNIFAGVEHHIVNRVPFRIGFQAVSNQFFTMEDAIDLNGAPIQVYNVNKIVNPMITAGSSIGLAKNVSIDLGFGYTWREYNALDLFGDAYYNDKTYTGAGSNSANIWTNPQYVTLTNRGWENPDKVRENNISLNAGISLSW
ncbi:MAG: hypothetical protein PHY48_04950 [Candidatus Cloacimonetes bacterium]|nr:hypothetical protein [Candidatus Cloacimonadota bacterium]